MNYFPHIPAFDHCLLFQPGSLPATTSQQIKKKRRSLREKAISRLLMSSSRLKTSDRAWSFSPQSQRHIQSCSPVSPRSQRSISTNNNTSIISPHLTMSPYPYQSQLLPGATLMEQNHTEHTTSLGVDTSLSDTAQQLKTASLPLPLRQPTAEQATCFPVRLHMMLSDIAERGAQSHVISWQPHGRYVVIISLSCPSA